MRSGPSGLCNWRVEYGLRVPARRDGRSRDDEALRNAFEIFFPGAQWVGDGKQLAVVIDGKTFHRNLELVVDAASGAAVGISVRDEEDSAAVVQAFTQGVATTGGTPLALLLDNRPSNHTPEVDAALDDTLRIRATPDRPQNKAHVEGCFGLFAQKVPPIFSGKRTAGTLPDGVDARYLLGIVRNLHHCHEAEPITEALIRERLSARDRFLAPLVAERDTILSASNGDVATALIALVDRLVRAERTLDRHVWLDAAADLVAPHPTDVRIDLAKRAARRIHTTFALSARDRAHLLINANYFLPAKIIVADHLERAFLRRLWPLT